AVSARAFDQLAAYAPTERLGGSNRYDTGLAIVGSAFDSAGTAFIATGRTFPDALAATGAAGSQGSPVILVDGVASRVSGDVLAALDRLGVSKIVIAGGPGAVSAGIEQQLGSRYSVERYGGADRYATAALINDAHFGSAPPDTMFLATG